MARHITKLGHTVKGALAAHLAPRLAADKALKPGELQKLLMDLKPTAFKNQIPVLTDSIKELVKGRLAKDADVEDLAELLEALGGEDLDDDDEELEDKGLTTDEDMGMDADPGEQLMEMLKGYNIPDADLEKLNALISKLGKPADTANDKGKAKDTFPPKKGEEKPGANAAPAKGVPVTQPAMDAAIKTALDAAQKASQESITARFNAARDVEPVLGRVDAMAFDSADSIYREALKVQGVPTDGVHPSALKVLLDQALKSQPATPTVAADAASYEDFGKRYPTIPMQA